MRMAAGAIDSRVGMKQAETSFDPKEQVEEESPQPLAMGSMGHSVPSLEIELFMPDSTLPPLLKPFSSQSEQLDTLQQAETILYVPIISAIAEEVCVFMYVMMTYIKKWDVTVWVFTDREIDVIHQHVLPLE